MIDRRIAEFLGEFLPAVARQERAQILAMGIVRTHVHVLLACHPTTSLPRLMQRLKGGSSVIAHKEGHVRHGVLFAWAKGYNIETVSTGVLSNVKAYVRGQARHHPRDAIPGWNGWRDRRRELDDDGGGDCGRTECRDGGVKPPLGPAE
jgi:REP element-mobilizing transposase RayT